MKKTIPKVVLFAIAFAFIEVAVVVYLRELFGLREAYPETKAEDIFLSLPGIVFLTSEAALKIFANKTILNIEMLREAATLVMLASVAALAGKKFKEKIAYFLLAFGIWDISYYVFLKLTIGWPKTLFDLDIFFLLPVAWAGPVFVPILVSTVLVLVTTFYLTKDSKRRTR